MEIAGVAVAFGSVMYLVSKNISMGISLIVGTCIAGLLSGMGLLGFGTAVAHGLLSSVTIELAIAVALISGLGKIMKENGDLELMIDSLVALFRRPKLLTMILPALIGTINVPGGAIMSAPMVEENGKILGLDATTKSAINLFFRHIGYFVYPLYSSLIILSELMDIPKLAILRYNAVTMLVGLLVAYLVFFRGVRHQEIPNKNGNNMMRNVANLLLGFSPILTALGLVLIFDLPFYLATAFGVLIGLIRGLPAERRGQAFWHKMGQFFTKWIEYKLVLVILGVMMFRSVIEASGVVSRLATTLFDYGTPLPILVMVLGVVVAYVIGTHMAASGVLAALFAPIIPAAVMAPYTALLFTAVLLGYLISPIHLCSVLTNQYFGSKYVQVVKKLALPVLAMLATAMVQLLLSLQ
jgi:integral membrane protein (TIGR00529 family)